MRGQGWHFPNLDDEWCRVRVLRELYGYQGALPSRDITKRILGVELGALSISSAIGWLKSRDLISEPYRRCYRITSKGRTWLEGYDVFHPEKVS